ncbi:hypothetical protein LTR84_010936 [Exophiala bonariae]|uniref:C2 NT-type domain-containing protein n=1 Tax=Exophiala bonariae TaxID=1690606 RepID=A0AAV9NIA2_9EURO|nr:hypothetical protein LTR84_010936 [Exophiala bonariae]
MATSWVIRLPRDDSDQDPFILKISRKEDGQDLDLDLLATDNVRAFSGKVQQKRLKKLQAKNYDGTDDEWSNILSYTFISKQNSSLGATQKKNLEVICSASGRKKEPHTLSITFRYNIEGIIQRLGVIELPEIEDTSEFDIFGWTLLLLEQRDKLQEEAAAQKDKADTEQATEAKLQKQLSDLVDAKVEHEKQLLSKFCTLLNEKKLKTRNMQRVLQTAQVDQKKLRDLAPLMGDDAEGGTRHGTKRQKDDGSDAEEDDESDGFESMVVDKATAEDEDEIESDAESPNSHGSRRSANPGSDTASEEEDDLDDARPVSPAPPQTRSMDKAASKKGHSTPLPPPRELPFQRKAAAKPTVDRKQPPKQPERVASPDDDDEETASEDDEL